MVTMGIFSRKGKKAKGAKKGSRSLAAYGGNACLGRLAGRSVKEINKFDRLAFFFDTIRNATYFTHQLNPMRNDLSSPETTPGPNKPDIDTPTPNQPETPLPPASPDPLPHPEPMGPQIKEDLPAIWDYLQGRLEDAHGKRWFGA